jgi:SAM-dependent MidA family methyltransferase
LATSGELADYIALMLDILADFEDIAVDLIEFASIHVIETSQALPSSGPLPASA